MIINGGPISTSSLEALRRSCLDGLAESAAFARAMTPALYDQWGFPIYLANGRKIGETIQVRMPRRFSESTGQGE